MAGRGVDLVAESVASRPNTDTENSGAGVS
jgi:hypothetical protein